MAQSKVNSLSDHLIRLRCSVCKHSNYTTHKNKKQLERKLEYKRYCNWCRKHTIHKEAKK